MKTPFFLPLITAACLSLTGCMSHGTHHANSGHYEAFKPGLGEIMALTSMRHSKLWFAGQGKNWALAEYELEELQEGFEDAGKFHPTHKEIKQALPDLISKTMDASLDDLEKAIKSKNSAQFIQAFDNLTTACNICHQVTDFGFNIVTRPSSNPYTNQVFTVGNP